MSFVDIENNNWTIDAPCLTRRPSNMGEAQQYNLSHLYLDTINT